MHHSTLFSLLIFPLAEAATNVINVRDVPASEPHVASIQYSGSGCPSSGPGVDKLGAWDDLAFRLNNFEITLPGVAASTENCEVHLQIAGCSAGWQLGIKDVYVRGHLVLDPGAELDFFVTSYWSQDAGTTVSSSFLAHRTHGTIVTDQQIVHGQRCHREYWRCSYRRRVYGTCYYPQLKSRLVPMQFGIRRCWYPQRQLPRGTFGRWQPVRLLW